MSQPIALAILALSLGQTDSEATVKKQVLAAGGSFTLFEAAPKRMALQIFWPSKSSSEVSDAELKQLAPLERLVDLSLTGTTATDDGLKEFLKAIGPSRLMSLNLNGAANLTDAGFGDLAGQKRLTSLSLGGTKITDAGLDEIAKIADLERLILVRTEITDAGVKKLAALKKLKTLELVNTAVADNGLKGLAGLGNLETLLLGRTDGVNDTTDDGLTALKGSPKLKMLAVYNAKLTAASVKTIAAQFPQLESLALSGNAIGDDALPPLAKMPKLRRLSLDRTNVTDDGLAILATMKRLDAVSLSDTKATDAGIQGLRLALPQCQVSARRPKSATP